MVLLKLWIGLLCVVVVLNRNCVVISGMLWGWLCKGGRVSLVIDRV